VFVKVKPQTSLQLEGQDSQKQKLLCLADLARNGMINIGTEGGQVTQTHGRFHGILLPFHSQREAYEKVNIPEFAEAFLKGSNCTLFMYGQTGSGKTHSLFGPPYCFSQSLINGGETEDFEGAHLPQVWGLFPRSALYLLSRLQTTLADAPDQCYLNASAVEVYLNHCYDLLNGKVCVLILLQLFFYS